MTFQTVTQANTNGSTAQANNSSDSGFDLNLYKDYNYASLDDNQSSSTLANASIPAAPSSLEGECNFQKTLENEISKPQSTTGKKAHITKEDEGQKDSIKAEQQLVTGNRDVITEARSNLAQDANIVGDNDDDDNDDDDDFDDFDDADFEIVSPVSARAQPKISSATVLQQTQQNINFNPKIEAPIDSEIKSQIPLRKFGHGILQQPSLVSTASNPNKSGNSSKNPLSLKTSPVVPENVSQDGFVTALSSPNVPHHQNALHLGNSNNNAVTSTIANAFSKLASVSSPTTSLSQKHSNVLPATQQTPQSSLHQLMHSNAVQTPTSSTSGSGIMSPQQNVGAAFTPTTTTSSNSKTPSLLTPSNFSGNNNIEEYSNFAVGRKFSLLHKQSPPPERVTQRSKQLQYPPFNNINVPGSSVDGNNVTPPQSIGGSPNLNKNGMYPGPQKNAGIPSRRNIATQHHHLQHDQDNVSTYSLSGQQLIMSNGLHGSSSKKKNKKYNKTGFGSLFITNNDKDKLKPSMGRKKRTLVMPGSPTASIETSHTMTSKMQPISQNQLPLLRGYNSPYESVDSADLNSKFNRSLNINDGSQRMMRAEGPIARINRQVEDDMTSIYSSLGKKKSWKKFF